MGRLVPLEPRLVKKLTQPLSDLIETSPAKSLQYECINTLLAGEIANKSTVSLILGKLEGYITSNDQNCESSSLFFLFSTAS